MGLKKSALRRRRLGGGNSAAPPKVAFRFRYEDKMPVCCGNKRKAQRHFAEEFVTRMGQVWRRSWRARSVGLILSAIGARLRV